MNCEDAILLISARLDGEIVGDDRARLADHLRDCPACAAAAEAFTVQDADLRQTFAERRRAADGVAARVVGRIPEAAVKPQGRWQRLLVGAAAVAAAAALAVFLYRQTPRNMPRIPDYGADLVASVGLTARPRPPARPTTTLAVGDTLTTGARERRRVALPDGSVAYVNELTRITLTAGRHLRLDKAGEVFVEAVPAPGSGDSFVLETAWHEYTTPGAKFAVRAQFPRPGLVVAQGAVRARGLSTPVDATVPAGFQLDAVAATVTPAPRAAHLLDWTRDLMAEADTPLVPGSRYAGGALVAVDASGQEAKLSLRAYHVDVHVEDGFARTTIDQTYFNHANWRLEGTFYFPLPADASLSRLAMYVDGKLMEGGMVDRDYGRRVYEQILTSQRDPALLECVDGSTFKMRVFPLEARQEKRIVLSYTQKLTTEYGQAQYRFPAGHSLELVRDWSFHARVVGGAPLLSRQPPPGYSSPMKIDLVKGDGRDLLFDARQRDVSLDRDVVLDLGIPTANSPDKDARFTAAEDDGARYLMLRFLPRLPASEPKQQRRDWVFLFESSGDRDPLLARTQIEIVRSLLGNAAPDDTFAVLTAGTNVRAFAPGLKPATPENVHSALEFLERSHLIGALDLGKALGEAEPLLRAAANPYLVHVGGGIAAMGERREDVLAKRVPDGTRYVGVGVGKRWGRGFMKTAAERSGGFVTQINPDEAISWRGFELASALLLPRLLDVKITDDAGRNYLTFATSAAHGEEVCAVARFERDVRLPEKVTVSGNVDGQPYRRELPLADVAENASYLPRVWAKLEIERLLAEDSRANKEKIVALSKATYVMTPFTSLLVLESEQMYRDFKVDRGRKDHWAMYPCPEKIPVVYEPDPNSPVDPRAAANQKPSPQQVMQTILVRVPPRCLTWPGAPAGPGGPVVTALQLWGGAYALPENAEVAKLGDLGVESSVRYDTLARDDSVRLFDARVPSFDWSGESFEFRAGLENLEVDLRVSGLADNLPARKKARLGRPVAFSPDGRESAFRSSSAVQIWDTTTGTKLNKGHGQDHFYNYFAEIDLDGATPADGLSRGDNVSFGDFGVKKLGFLSDKNSGLEVSHVLGQARAPRLYGRPSFSNDERVFSDLLAYAPGLNTSRADAEAVVEAEAAPSLAALPGRVDTAAHALVDRARAAGWQTRTVSDRAGKPVLTFTFDGAGRFAYERTLPPGLREKVVCDGKTILYLYPDLGVGARRTVSRFHRAELARLVPWALPPAGDLARGHDVTALDERTVAVDPRGAAAARTPEGKPVTYLRQQLVFAADGRLAERRAVAMPEGKLLASEAYAADGTVTVLDGVGKEVATHKTAVVPAAAPDLTPDTSALVVLPLPFRSREHVYAALGFNPNASLNADENRCHESLPADDALALFTANAAAQNPSEAHIVYRNCFLDNGDRRPGYYALLAAAGGSFGTDRDFVRLVAGRPQDPLTRYLALLQYPHYRTLQVRFGIDLGESGLSDQRFFGALASFRDRWLRWSAFDPAKAGAASRRPEEERGLAFVRGHAATPFGWALLTTMADRAGEDNARFHRELADAWGLFVDRPSLGYAARYERARSLLHGGKRDEARALYQEMFAQALKDNVLPALDTSFREALRGDGKDADRWNELMRQTASDFVSHKRRPAVVALAWQCWQLGDAPLASNLLDEALRGASGEERLSAALAAVAYLVQTGQHAPADALLSSLLEDDALAKNANLWRVAANVAEARGLTARAVGCLERALAREYEELPEVIDLEGVRRDYGKLLEHYQALARAVPILGVAPPRDLAARTVRAADCWRALDRQSEAPCQSAATTLRLLGAPDLAWEYLTTPLGQRPNDAGPWRSLAETLAREGQPALADRAYVAAFEAEPTDAQILWDRARNLRQAGRLSDAQALLRQLADGDWQPRFNGLRDQARWQLEGR